MKCFRVSLRLAWVCMCVGSGACSLENEVPPEPIGQIISGTVTYAGAAHTSFTSAALSITAFAGFPPAGSPHGALTVDVPDFSEGPVPFELKYVPVYSYYVIASIIDRDVPDEMSGPTGAFPNMCALFAPNGPVPVVVDSPTEDIDIVLYDQGGAADPCFVVDLPCSDDGLASLILNVVSARDPIGVHDVLRVALFTSNPPMGPPVATTSLTGENLSFPAEVFLTNVTPATYYVNACLDVDGDNPMGCGAGDVSAFYPAMNDSGIDLVADRILHVEIDIDAGTGVTGAQRDPSEVGCE